MGCAFCAIVAGEAPADLVFENRSVVAFLDRRPVFKGHCLVVPRRHEATLAELPPSLVEPFFHAVQRIARAVEEGLGADGTFVAVNNRVSQSVPHLHVHVVPRRFKDGLRGFFWPRQKYENDEEVADVRERIRARMLD